MQTGPETIRRGNALLFVPHVYPHPPRLDDPERTVNRASFQDREKIPETIHNCLNRGARADLQNDDASAPLGREACYLAEIMIEGDECPAFACTDLEQFLIGGASETLIPDRHHIVAGSSQKLQTTPPDIFVELELHAYSATGTGTMCSRAISAP